MNRYNGLSYSDSDPDNQSKKPVMVFLHGFFMDSRMFKHQVKYFKNDYRVICCDFRGFGRTQWQREDFSLDDLVHDIITLLDHLLITRCVLAGMSMGGYVAQRIALQIPERIDRLILIATQAGKDNPETVKAYHELRDNWGNSDIRTMIIEGLLPAILGESSADNSDSHNEEVAFWRTVWTAYHADNIYYPMSAMTSRKAVDGSLIQTPALVIHGTADTGIPIAAGQALSEAIPNARFIAVHGAGHAVNLTHPEPVNKAISDFLTDPLAA